MENHNYYSSDCFPNSLQHLHARMDMNSSQQSSSVSQITDSAQSSDRTSILSPVQLPFSFSSSEYFSYADFKVPRPPNAIMTGGGNNIVYKYTFVISIAGGIYQLICKLCGEACKGTLTRVSSHFLGPVPGSKNNLKQCSKCEHSCFPAIQEEFRKLDKILHNQGRKKRNYDEISSQSGKRQANIQQMFTSMNSNNFKNDQLVDHAYGTLISCNSFPFTIGKYELITIKD